MIKHVAWDRGAIHDALVEALGFAMPQKTTKTKCGKRVVVAHIDNGRADCQACLAELARERDGYVMIHKHSLEAGYLTQEQFDKAMEVIGHD
jgi:hypothetical protein